MPHLDVPFDNATRAKAITLALMLFPTDANADAIARLAFQMSKEKVRNECDMAGFSRLIRPTTMPDANEIPCDMTEYWRDSKYEFFAPGMHHTDQARLPKCRWAGKLAGCLLARMIQSNVHHKDLCSFRKQVSGLSRWYEANQREAPHSESTIHKAWRDYSPIAHLWAAHAHLGSDFEIRELWAVAQAYTSLGSEVLIAPKGAKKYPLISSDDVWTVEGIETAQIDVPPLSPEQFKVISEGKPKTKVRK